jgi:hypothetical protein
MRLQGKFFFWGMVGVADPEACCTDCWSEMLLGLAMAQQYDFHKGAAELG